MVKLYSNYSGVLTDESVRETYVDPVTGVTLPRYSFRFSTTSTSGSGLTFTWCNEIKTTSGSPTSNGSLTPVSTYQCYSAHTNGIQMSGTNYGRLSSFSVFKNLSDEENHSYEKLSIWRKTVDWSRYPLRFYYKRSGVQYDLVSVKASSASFESYNYYYDGNPHIFADIYLNWSVATNFNTSYSHYIDFTIPEFPDISVSGGTPTPTETATISISLDNASCNIDPNTEYVVGSTVSIIVTPNSGYVFSTAPKFNDTAMSPVGDGSYYVNATITSNNSVTGSAVEIQRVVITTDYVHCSDDVSGGFSVGDTANITLTCDDGYIFTDFPTINQSGVVISFSLSEDFKKAYISFKVRGDFSIYAHAILSSENTYGFYAIYEPSDDFLKAFSQNHVYMFGAGTVTEYDLTPFIYNIYKLPFNVENYTNAETVSGVQFYKYTYNVPTKYIPDDGHIFNVDFGVINVPRQFNNDYDYDAKITLETPFFASVPLDAYRVIGGSVHVVGTVNLYERTMYVDVYDKNGTCISETKQQIGYSFPIVTDTFKQTGAYSDELSNSLESARIVVDYDFAIAKISTLIGTVYADDVNLIGFTGTASEREQLENIIKGGINLEQ